MYIDRLYPSVLAWFFTGGLGLYTEGTENERFLRVFMSRKEKTVLNEGSGGAMNPVQVLHRSQQTAKLLEKAAPSKHRFAGSDG